MKGKTKMPFDSEGIFSRLHNWEDDRINDIDIVTDHMDEEDDNFADGLSQCFLKNGLAKMQGDINVNNFKVKNVANGTLSTDAVNKSQLDTLNTNLSNNITDLAAHFQVVESLPAEPDADTFYFITA